ncbi:MAG: sulfite exporter TauE/SafE family protein [Verrucomicrobiales bacterium]|nr:sulfite exporter TauE/SafE family protein [Verrucomicrobiales bacterium]
MMLFIGMILFVAAVVQGLIGFAMAIVAIPLLVWTGLPLSEAIAVSMASTMVQALTGMFKLRHAIPWEIVRLSLVVRSLSLPIGILIMVQLDGIETSEVKAVLGSCIILIVLVKISLKIEPKEKLAAKWNYFAFACSGLFAGMVGMGGPPLVLWVAAHQWNGDKIKAFLFANFAILSPVGLLMIWMALGPNILRAAGKGFLFAPLVILGSLLGVWLGTFVPRERLRMILYIMLIVMGIASIVMAR